MPRLHKLARSLWNPCGLLPALVVIVTACGDPGTTGTTSGADTQATDSNGADLQWFADATPDVEPDAASDISLDISTLPDTQVGMDADTTGGDTTSSDAAGCSEAGCPCTENSQCGSQYCIETASGRQCAQLCQGTCAGDFTCIQVGGVGTDALSICVPRHPRLCEPCAADSDCNNVLGGSDSRCVPYIDNNKALVGNFCASQCSANSDCPSGFGCVDTTSVGGAKTKQCVRSDLQCTCDVRATTMQLTTACSQANNIGTCGGKRSCGKDGLTACDAATAGPEQCNLIDDDCDGQTDEPTPGLCDDGTVCTYDNCIAGQCQHPPKTGPCDDASACTGGDKCSDGECVGTAIACDDKNPCTIDACTPASGCTATADDSASCDDGSACTTSDACSGGLCSGGAPLACDDGNPCTTDSCAPKTGCVFADNTLPCSDGDVCTLGDACKVGKCSGVSTLPCADGNPCTDDACDGQLGCLFVNNTLPCNDNNACTSGEQCKSGVCTPVGAVPCDDGNPCTTDLCDVAGGCKTEPNTAPCNDNDVCTTSDTCTAGACTPGKALTCSDGNPCTTDSCDPAVGCLFDANAAPCNDNNPCTVGDQCASGNCSAGTPLVCTDGDLCTDDTCNPASGCVFVANGAACNDGDACSLGDTCKGGVCQGTAPQICNDGNPCTTDSCEPSQGCKFVANTAPCDDGNACSDNDTCSSGKCVPGKFKVCSDGNPCTDDACLPAEGCVTTPNTASCNDNNPCTSLDTCAQGSCAGGPATNCDDGNACSDDSCDPAKGCQHTGHVGSCSDGNACTTGDACSGVVCVPGIAKTCSDGNACTDDSCDASKGCVFVNNTASCDDGNACTVSDACAGGGCAPGSAKVCNDANLCTDDGCDKTLGCLFPSNAAKCNDNNPCTTDTCNPATGCSNTPVADLTDCGTGLWCKSGVCTTKTQQTFNTLNFNGMTGYPLDYSVCNCCPPTTTKQQMDAFCVLAGMKSAVTWATQSMQINNCYCWGSCSGSKWQSNCCSGWQTQTMVTSVTCQ